MTRLVQHPASKPILTCAKGLSIIKLRRFERANFHSTIRWVKPLPLNAAFEKILIREADAGRKIDLRLPAEGEET